MTPYYSDEYVTLFHADCLEGLPLLDLDAAACVTDPPYNARKKYGEGTNDNQAWPEWAEWLDDRFDAWATCPDTFMFLSQTAYRHYVRHGRRDVDWSAIWHKPLSMAVCAAPWMPHWEHIVYFGERKKGQERHPDGRFVKGQFGGDVLTANVEVGKKRWGGHPTPKPERLMVDLIERLDHPLILDPFAGSGTTLAAAKTLGRKAIGIEIEERWAETIARRLEQTAYKPRIPGFEPITGKQEAMQ